MKKLFIMNTWHVLIFYIGKFSLDGTHNFEGQGTQPL